jgi:hypothetical protein
MAQLCDRLDAIVIDLAKLDDQVPGQAAGCELAPEYLRARSASETASEYIPFSM